MRRVIFSFIFVLVLLVPAYGFASGALEEHVLPFEPVELDDETAYVTPHVFAEPDTWEIIRWVEVEVPAHWVSSGYRYEIWDENNEPHYTHTSRWLYLGAEETGDGTMRILLSQIDPSDDPGIRIVVFVPEGQPHPETVRLRDPGETDETLRASAAGYPSARFVLRRGFDALRLVLYVLSGLILMSFAASLVVTLRKPKALMSSLLLLARPSHIRDLSKERKREALAHLTVVLILGAGVYGIILGAFTGGIQILYVLLKMPLLLLTALAIAFLSGFVLSKLLGATLAAGDAFLATIAALTSFSLGLGSLSIVLSLFLLRDPGHDSFLVVNAFLFILAGLLATTTFVRFQLHLVGRKFLWVRVGIWLLIYGVVVLQVGWMLRPWVGLLDPGQHVPFLRLFTGNAFEELMRAVIRLIDGGML